MYRLANRGRHLFLSAPNYEFGRGAGSQHGCIFTKAG